MSLIPLLKRICSKNEFQTSLCLGCNFFLSNEAATMINITISYSQQKGRMEITSTLLLIIEHYDDGEETVSVYSNDILLLELL